MFAKAKCKELGIAIQGYGVLNSTFMGNDKIKNVIEKVANRTGRTTIQTCIRWTVQKGVCAILRSGSKENQAANLAALEGPDLSPEDMATIDDLEDNYPYYWLPEATVQTVNGK